MSTKNNYTKNINFLPKMVVYNQLFNIKKNNKR